MKHTVWNLAALLGVSALLIGNIARGDELKVGDKAPDFSLVGSDGKTYTLADFKGKQAVVLAWFPKAFTGGCTKECKSIHANGDKLKPLGIAYFTASVDTAEVNKKFAESLELDYPVLSDPDKKVAAAYGVVHDDRKVAERVDVLYRQRRRHQVHRQGRTEEDRDRRRRHGRQGEGAGAQRSEVVSAEIKTHQIAGVAAAADAAVGNHRHGPALAIKDLGAGQLVKCAGRGRCHHTTRIRNHSSGRQKPRTLLKKSGGRARS